LLAIRLIAIFFVKLLNNVNKKPVDGCACLWITVSAAEGGPNSWKRSELAGASHPKE
jgi:hypothetical protein